MFPPTVLIPWGASWTTVAIIIGISLLLLYHVGISRPIDSIVRTLIIKFLHVFQVTARRSEVKLWRGSICLHDVDVGPASVDCLDLPFHCTALHADSAGVFLTRNPSGALPFSLTLRIQGIRFLATTRKSPTSRTREEQLAVDRDAETLNRHDKLRDTELLLWGDRQRRGLVQRFVRFFARQVSFLLASVLRLELTDLALGTKLDIPRPAQADDNDAGLRGSAVLLTVGSLQVDQQASSSWGVLSIAASLRNLTASALMPRGPNGAGVRPPGALSPSGDTLPLSTGVYDGAESEPSLSREGSPPVAKGVRLSWAGRAPPGGPARTKIGPDGPWLDHESEVATWAAGLETVPVLKRWGFKGAFSWGIASAFYDTSRPVYEGSLELNAMLVTVAPCAIRVILAQCGAVLEYLKYATYRQVRPQRPVLRTPQEWWAHAIWCTRRELRRATARFCTPEDDPSAKGRRCVEGTLATLLRRKEYCAQYMEVRRLRALGSVPGLRRRLKDAQRKLEAMEDGINLHDIVLFRWWAWSLTPPSWTPLYWLPVWAASRRGKDTAAVTAKMEQLRALLAMDRGTVPAHDRSQRAVLNVTCPKIGLTIMVSHDRPPTQREVASAEALELSLHGMEAKLFVGTGATASASSPGAGHPHALSGSPSRLEVSIHGLHGSHRPAGPLPQRQHRRAAAFSPNTIIVSPQGFRGLRDGGEQGKDSGGPGWKRGWGSVRMRGILRGLTGLVSQLRHATGKAEEREPDFFHLVWTSNPSAMTSRTSGKALEVQVAPCDLFYLHEAALKIADLARSVSLPPEVDPAVVSRLMTVQQSVEDGLAVARFKQAHALALTGEYQSRSTALSGAIGTVRLFFSTRGVDRNLTAGAVDDSASTVRRKSSVVDGAHSAAGPGSENARGPNSELPSRGNGSSSNRPIHRLVVTITGFQARSAASSGDSAPGTEGQTRPSAPEWAPTRGEENVAGGWRAESADPMATWMQRRKGVIGVVAQQIRFGVSAALVEAESGVRSPSGLPEASIWLLRDVAFRVCLTSGQEPVPLLSRFRPVTNLSVATSTLRLRISPFVQGYLRALAFDLGAHIPPAPSAPSSPAHRRQSAHAHKRTDSMTSPLGPGRPAAARGLIHSVMGLQVAVESILLAMHTREGEPLPDMCTAGVRRLAVSLARDSQEVDFRASLQQVVLVDHTAETGADIKQDWRRRPGYPWSAWEHQILQAAPLLSCEDSCLARVRSNRARLRVAFTAWREATASAAPDPALARDAEPGDKSDGGPRSAGWGRIANSSEHLAPLPTGQVFVLASLPEAGRPFFSVELGHVGLKIDADLPRRAIEAAVGFLESARSIIESLAHSSDDAGPIPGRVGPRGSELAGESPDEDGAPSGDGDVAEKEAFLSLLQSAIHGWRSWAHTGDLHSPKTSPVWGGDEPVTFQRDAGVGVELELSLASANVLLIAQGKEVARIAALDTVATAREVFTPLTEEAALYMRSGAAVLEPHVVNVRCDWTVAARVGDLTVTDCIAPSRSPYAHVLQGTQGGLCALEVAVFNTASRGDWRRHSWVRPPMATPARRVNHPHRPQRTLSNIPASFVSTMPHASALSHDFDAHPLGHPLSPTASIPPGMDLGAEAAMSPSWATPGENMDATPLSATMTPSRTLWHRRRGTMLDGLETPGTPPPQGQGAPATPQSARRDKGSQEKLGWRAQRAQYWAKAAEREARTVVRVSVSHARTALVFRFLWDILFFGFDLADAAAPARERICAALSLGDAPEQPPPDRPSFPRRKSDDGSESADSSDAGGGAPAQLPMTVEVSVRDLWVDVPRNSLSEQLFVARFDSARLLLPASADKALDDRQILRSSAVGPVLDPSGAETSSQWLSEKRMRAKLNREILGGKARLADPPASTLGESALWDVSDDFLSLISASDLSSALSPRPGVLRIDASGVRIFQAQYEVNTLTGFRPGPLPNVPLAAVATPHGRRMAVPRDLAPYNRIPGAAHAMPGAAAGASALRQSAAEAVLLKGPPRGDRRGSAEKTRGGLSTQPESRQERDSGRYSSGWDSGTSRQAGRGGARVGGTHGLGERSGRPRLGSGFVAQSRWVGVSSPGMHWRHIGAGSDILVTMEMGPTEAFSSWRLRALWPVASMVVGESQYDLLMGVVSENLCEGPSFVNPDIGYPHVEPGTFFGRPIGVPLPPVPPPPDAIGLDEGALSKQWDVGVDVSRIELVMETPNDGLPLTVRSVQGFGESPLLLFKGTDVGVGVHQYDGRGLRVRVGLQGAAASDIRWEDRMPPVPLLRVSPPVRGTTLAARRWREAVATLRGRPAPSVDENHHESAWPDARLSYDLTMQQDGPMAMEIRAFWGSFNWPFLADLSLIWNIVDCTTRYWWQPYVAPRPQRPGPDDWLYVNVLLTSPTFRVPTPASAAPRGPDEPPFESREALVARSEQLRVLYSCGGDREATLRVDIQRLMATLRGASGELSPGAGPLIRPFRGFLEVNWHLPKDIRAPVGLAVKLALTELVIRPAFTHIPHLATLAATLPASIPETPQDDADVPSRPSSPGSPSVPAPNERTLSRARLSTALGRNGMPADEDADGRTLSRDRLSSVIGRSLGSPSGDEGLSTPRARSVRASGWGNRRGSESDDASPLGREPSRVSRRISSSQSVRQLMDTVSQAVDHDRAEKTLLEELVTAAQFRPTVTTVTALLERASVCLVDDRGATPIEVLVASISRANAMVAHETVLPDTPANLVWRVTLSVDVRFLNSAIAQMEPLLEPWVVVAESRSVGGSTSVLLTSSDTVRVVLSPVCMRSVGDALCFHETFMALLASHQEALLSAASQAARPSRQAPRFSLDGRPHLRTLPTLDRLLSSPRAWVPRTAQGNALYVVRNETGCQLSFWADFGGARGAANELMFEIGQGEEASLPMEPIPKIVRMAESQLDIEARTITLQLEGNVHTVENVVIDKAGAFAYLFRAPHGGEDQRVPLIVDVGLEHRTHKIVVRSPYTLRNDTRFPLHFKLHMHRGVVGSRLQALPGGGEMLAPGAECFMPVEHMQSCRLFVGAEGHHRSEKDVVNIEAGREDLRDQQGLITCDPEDTAAPPLVVCLDVSTTILTTLSPDNALIRVPCHTLVFRPVLRLVNLLPAEADFILWDPRTNVGERQRLQPGRTMECYRFDLHHKLLLNVTYGVMQVTAAVAHQPISDILEKDFLSVIEDAKRKTRREVTRMSALELTHTLTGTPMRLGFSLSQRSSVIGHWKELAVLSPHWIVNESGFDLKWRDKPSVVAAVNPAMAAAEPGIARRRRRNEPPLPLGSLRGIVQLSLRFGTPWSHGINLNQVGTKGALCLETSWPLEWEGDVRLREAKHQRPASHHPNASSSGQEHENLLSLRPALSPQADAERDQRGSWTVWNSWDPSMHEVAQESARVHGVRPGMPVWYLSAQRADVKWDRAHGVHHIVRNITRPREGRGQPKARELRPRLEFAVDISMGPGPFSDTRVVSLTPRFTLHNRTHCDIEVAQRGVFLRGLPVVCRIPANASVPFHWPDGATKPELIFRLAEEHGHGLHSDSFLFSGAFRLDTAEDVAFFVPQGPGDDPPPPRPDTPESMPRSPGEEGERRRAPPRRGVIVHAVMKQDRASMSATFFSGRPPPYRIENRCRNTRVFFRQVLKDDTAQEHAVLEPCKIPGKWQTVPYAWDEPLDVRRLEVIIERENFKDASGPTHEYALDDIKVHPAIVLQRRREQGVGGWEQMKEAAIAKLGQRKKERLAGTENVFVAVYADGPTRVLAFSDSQDVLRQLRNEEQEMAMQRRRHEKLTERLEHARTRLQALCRGRVRVYANQIPRADSSDLPVVEEGHERELSHPGNGSSHQGSFTEAQGSGSPSGAARALVKRHSTVARMMSLRKRSQETEAAYTDLGVARWDSSNADGSGDSGADRGEPFVASRRQPPHGGSPHGSALGERGDGMACVRQSRVHGLHGDNADTGALLAADGTEFLGGQLAVTVLRAEGLGHGGQTKAMDCYAILECQGERRSTPSARGAGTIYWNEEMVFSAVHVFSDLRIALFSRSVIGSDNFLGEILVPLRDVAIDFGDDQADDPVLQPKREERRFALARRTTRHATSGELILTLGWIRSELETLTLRNGLLERELDNLLEDLAKTLEEESVGRGEPRDLLRPLSAPSETGSYAASVAQSDAVTATSRTLRTLVRSRLGPGPRSVAADSAPSSPSMGGAASSVTGTSMSGVDGLLGLAESELGIDAALGARFSAPGRLEVGILEARNLHGALGKTVLGATLDAFCLAVLRTGVGAMGAQSHATRVVRNSVSPSWNETFVFEPAQLSDTLEVTLLDRRRGRSNRVLGTLRIPIANLGDTTPRYAWLPLCAPRPHRRKERRSEAASGEVRLRLRWRDDLTVGAGVSAMHVEVGFKGLGVLVMDSGLHDMQTRQPREVMHASATDIDVTLRRSAVHEALHVAVRSVQVDNQLLSSRHPVVLGRGTTHAGRMNGEALPTGAGLDKPIKGHIQHKEAVALGAVPMITLSWERHFNHPTINFFRSFLLGFQEMDIVVEEELIDAIVSLIRRIPWDDLKQPKHVVAHGTSARAPRRRDAASKKKRDDGPTPAEELQSLVERMARTGVEPTPDAFAYSRYYFEALAILPIYVSITVLPYAAGRGQNAGLDYLANPNLGQAMRFFRTLGINLLDVNHVPVQIRMLHFSNALVDRRELMRDIAQHYRNQAIHEIYKILGVVDILAPVNFVANMSYGVVSTASSLLLASREGNVRDIALALAGGTGSLMKTSVYGMFATAGQMMGGFAKGFSKLALDDQFMLRSRRRPTGILSGLSLGAQDLVSGIIDGMAGLVKNPLIGAEKKGARGFVKGVATGVLGIAFKPVTGVLEFTSKAVAGVAASVQQVGVKGPSDGAADLGRVRAPAVAVLGRQVGVNEELCARWTEVVQRVRGGRYRKEVAVDLLQNKPNKAVIFTNNRIVYLNLRKRLVRWTARYSSINKLELFGLTLVLLCRVNYKRLHIAMPRKRSIACKTRELQHSLLTKLTVMLERAGGSERAEEGTASDGDVPQPDSASETDDEVIPDDVDLSIMLKAPGTVLFPSRPASSKPPSETTATAPGHPPRPPPLGSPASPSKSLPAPAPPHYRSGANHSPGGASAAWPHPRDAASEDVPTSKGVRLKDRIKSVFARLKKKRPPREPSDGDPTLEDAAPHGHPHDAPARPPGPVADLARTFNRTASQSPPGGARAHAPHRLASKAPAAGVTEWPPDAPAAVRSWEVADVGVNAPEEGASEGGVRRAVLSHAEAMQCIAAGIPDHPITPDAAEAAAGAIRTLSRMAVEELGRAKERGSAATRQARQLLTSLEEWADRLEMCAENPGVAAGTICALCGAVIRCLS